MKHTDAEIEEAARRFEELADKLDPETAEVEDLADLRAIAEAAERARRDEALLTERVALARAHGRSWNGSLPPWASPGRPPASGSAAKSARDSLVEPASLVVGGHRQSPRAADIGRHPSPARTAAISANCRSREVAGRW